MTPPRPSQGEGEGNNENQNENENYNNATLAITLPLGGIGWGFNSQLYGIANKHQNRKILLFA